MDSTEILMVIAVAVSAPGLFIIFLVAQFLSEFQPPAPRVQNTRVTNTTTNTVNIYVQGNLIVQAGDGQQRTLPAHQVQALLAGGETVRVIDPDRHTIEEYSRGQLVRRGELVSSETAITRR